MKVEKTSLSLCKWRSGFNLAKALSPMAPTCVRLPSPPLKFLDEEIIARIANSFGHFLSLDNVTKNRSKFVFARFCGNAETQKFYPTTVTLESKLGQWTREILYENTTLYCWNCSSIRHLINACPNAGEKKKNCMEAKNKALLVDVPSTIYC